MKIIKNVLKFIIFMLIFIFLLDVTSKTFTPNWINPDGESGQIYTIKGLYEEKQNSLDVLFVGDSNLYKGITPMKLWEDYGISSYTYGISSARIYTVNYLIKDALRNQKPKVIVIDTATLFYPKAVPETEPERRKSFDYMQMSKVKIDAINDKVFENDNFEKLSYVFPIFRYHSRWTEVSNKDLAKLIKNYKYKTKGYQYVDVIAPQNKEYSYMDPKVNNAPSKMTETNKEYLEKTIKYCKDNNIEIVLIGIPDTKSWRYNNSVEMKKFAEEHNVVFLDYNNEQSGIDLKTDMSDAIGVHLNLYGAEKLTDHVGKYLHENFTLPDHRNDKDYQSWNKDLEKYKIAREKSYKKLNNR